MPTVPAFFGNNTAITIQTDSTVPGLAGVTRPVPDFSSALDEVVDARVWSGIHFRYADVDARRLGRFRNVSSSIATAPL
jgi:hypothetical protein